MLATNSISKIIPINGHRLYILLKSLRTRYILGLSRSRTTPIPVLADMIPYAQKIFQSNILPCFNIDFKSQMVPLNRLNLNLKKQDCDIRQAFYIQTQKFKQTHNLGLLMHQRKMIVGFVDQQICSSNCLLLKHLLEDIAHITHNRILVNL